MTTKPDVKTAFQELHKRALRDEALLKLLDDIDRVAAQAESVSPDPDTGASLTRLPYSSDPPPRGEKWLMS